MQRQVESVHTFTRNPKYRMQKEKVVVRCDDGTVYEFEDSNSLPKGSPPRLVRGFQPDGSLTHTGSYKRVPDAVDETLDTLFGGWSK